MPFRLQGVGEPVDGRYSEMKLALREAWDRVGNSLDTDQVLANVKKAYNQQPQPERLETFDPTLAGDTAHAGRSPSAPRGLPFCFTSGSGSATGRSAWPPSCA